MDSQSRDTCTDWEKFFNPESLRENLITASLFLASWEILCTSIIGRIRDFFTFGFDENGLIVDGLYKDKVLSLDKSRFKASLIWLKTNSVITEADIHTADEIHKHGNELAHELPNFITSAKPNSL